MKELTDPSRRQFPRSTALGLAAAAIPLPALAGRDSKEAPITLKGRSCFTMWQIPSHENTIGNSYVFRTHRGRLIVMDGGMPAESMFLRGFLGAMGGEVEAWFISHPHGDHMGALLQLLRDRQELRIKHIYHSRMPEPVIQAEPDYEAHCREFYATLDTLKDIQVTDIQEPGETFCWDGMNLQILGVANDFTTNPYNNSSMVMRVWDRRKSITFLGDAGVECGDKVLNGPYADRLHCDYLQMAHHGQRGCSEEFYRSVKFRACLWPTPLWVWNNDQGKGFNTGILETLSTRVWMDRLGIKEHHVTCTDGMWQLD